MWVRVGYSRVIDVGYSGLWMWVIVGYGCGLGWVMVMVIVGYRCGLWWVIDVGYRCGLRGPRASGEVFKAGAEMGLGGAFPKCQNRLSVTPDARETIESFSAPL